MGKGFAWVRISLNTIHGKYSPKQRLGDQMIVENVAYYLKNFKGSEKFYSKETCLLFFNPTFLELT